MHLREPLAQYHLPIYPLIIPHHHHHQPANPIECLACAPVRKEQVLLHWFIAYLCLPLSDLFV